MAAKRGSHSRSANQAPYQQNPQGRQGSARNAGQPAASQREAYERAYRRYVQGQNAAGQAQGRQAPYQGETAQQAYQRRATQQAYQRRAQAGGLRQDSPYVPYGQPPMRNFELSKKKKRHPVRNTLLVLLLLIVIVGGVGGFTGYTLYNSAKTVRSDASAVMANISDLKAKIISDDPSQANATASEIARYAKDMKAETDGWEWTVASYVPVYGSDVAKVKELANVFDELATQAIVPLVSEASQISLKNLMSDGGINVEYTTRLVNALSDAAPVIERAADTVENMGTAQLDQVNAPIQKARSTLGKLNTAAEFAEGLAPQLSHMLGADGGKRTYLIVAQTNAEIHSTGGFLGSIGPMYIENGKIELGDFRTIYDIYPKDGNYAPITDEEYAIFGQHVSSVPGNSGWIPDWSRVGAIESFYWEAKGYGSVDGVVGCDPIFLQDMIGLVGSVTLSDGTVLDGSNTARVLMHDVYNIESGDAQDAVFEETAQLAFGQFMGNLKNVNLMTFAKQVKKDMDEKHLQAWMKNEDEEATLAMLGATGTMDDHATDAPTIGVYVNDIAFSKLSWYLKLGSSVSEGVRNDDGSTTYTVTVNLSNMITDYGDVPTKAIATNKDIRRSEFDMCDFVYVSVPKDADITQMFGTDGYITVQPSQSSLEGHEFWSLACQIEPYETVSIAFDVVMPAGVEDKPVVEFSPNAMVAAGW